MNRRECCEFIQKVIECNVGEFPEIDDGVNVCLLEDSHFSYLADNNDGFEIEFDNGDSFLFMVHSS